MRGGNPGEGGSMVAGWDGRGSLAVGSPGMPHSCSAALVRSGVLAEWPLVGRNIHQQG